MGGYPEHMHYLDLQAFCSALGPEEGSKDSCQISAACQGLNFLHPVVWQKKNAVGSPYDSSALTNEQHEPTSQPGYSSHGERFRDFTGVNLKDKI
ncbi:unnamed protein product [Caretta caretta]